MLHHPFYPSEIMEAIRDRQAGPVATDHPSPVLDAIFGLWCALCASLVALAILVA